MKPLVCKSFEWENGVMKTITIAEAERDLAAVLNRATAGEDIVIVNDSGFRKSVPSLETMWRHLEVRSVI